MTAVAIDVALIQPLVYSLDTWIELRSRLAECVTEDGSRGLGFDGARWHLSGSPEPLFDRSLEGAENLVAAFPEILRQARAFPCIVVPLDTPASALLLEQERWLSGLRIDAAESHLLLPRMGDPIVLHLASGRIDDADALSGADRQVQREIRTLYRTVIESEGGRFYGLLEGALARILGGQPSERVRDVFDPWGGHLVTWSRATAPALISALQQVHAIEEGTGGDQTGIVLPAASDQPRYLRLGWSYSTVATPDVGFSYRLLFPLIGVNQAWYRYRQLRGDIIEMSEVVDGLETDRDLAAWTRFFNKVVLQVRIWDAERESFERGLQPVYRSAYDQLWSYWDTDESRGTVHAGIDQTRDFVDRKYRVKMALRENTQSRILFVIALFQILSVFGLVSSYLYFWEETRLPESVIFDSEIMVWATLLSPVLVLGLIVWLLVTFLRRHR